MEVYKKLCDFQNIFKKDLISILTINNKQRNKRIIPPFIIQHIYKYIENILNDNYDLITNVNKLSDEEIYHKLVTIYKNNISILSLNRTLLIYNYEQLGWDINLFEENADFHQSRWKRSVKLSLF